MTKPEEPQKPAVGSLLERGVGRLEPERDLVERLRDTPNWMRESYGSWKDSVLKYDRAPFEAADELVVLRCQVDSLRAALVKVLETREKEAAAHMAFQVASDNYASGASREGRQHLHAMTAASDAEKEARLLLATLKTPNK